MWIIRASFLVCGLSLFSLAPVVGQSALTTSPHIEAARNREEKGKCVSIVFKWTEVYAPGSMSDMAGGLVSTKGPVPSIETTLDSTNRMWIAGDKIRYEENHPSWFMPSGQLLQRSRVEVYNGSYAKSYYERGMQGNGEAFGHFQKAEPKNVLRSYQLAPIMLTFRAMNPSFFPFAFTEMQPTGVTLPIDGVPCQEYVIKVSQKATVSFWLDPASDYVVRRFCQQEGRRIQEQTTIRYRRHDVCGWAPMSWVRTKYSATGTVLVSTTVEVTEVGVEESFPADLFNLQFPAGSIVHDADDSKSYRVQLDGSMRQVSSNGEEIGGSVAQPEGVSLSRPPWFLICVAIALMTVGVLYVMQRRKSRHG